MGGDVTQLLVSADHNEGSVSPPLHVAQGLRWARLQAFFFLLASRGRSRACLGCWHSCGRQKKKKRKMVEPHITLKTCAHVTWLTASHVARPASS